MFLRSILRSTRRPDITFHNDGRVDISSRIVRALDMKPGDVIDILTGSGEIFLYVMIPSRKVCGSHEAQCQPTKAGSRNFRASSVRLCREMLAISRESSRARFSSGDLTTVNGHKAICLIPNKTEL